LDYLRKGIRVLRKVAQFILDNVLEVVKICLYPTVLALVVVDSFLDEDIGWWRP